VALVALIVAAISGFIAWFNIGGSGFSLMDAYVLVLGYASRGVAAFGTQLGAIVYSATTGHPDLLVAFVIVLVFWPAMVVSGLVEIVGRGVRPHPGIYGIIAFIASYFFVNAASSRGLVPSGSMALGTGAWLSLAAIIIFFVAYGIYSGERSRARSRAEELRRQPGPAEGTVERGVQRPAS